MTEGITLFAKRINHGQSEIWLSSNRKELTERRTLATNEVLNVTRRHCSPEVLGAFYAEYQSNIGRVAALLVPNLDEVAAELRLKE
jgi:hypothetical protein